MSLPPSHCLFLSPLLAIGIGFGSDVQHSRSACSSSNFASKSILPWSRYFLSVLDFEFPSAFSWYIRCFSSVYGHRFNSSGFSSCILDIILLDQSLVLLPLSASCSEPSITSLPSPRVLRRLFVRSVTRCRSSRSLILHLRLLAVSRQSHRFFHELFGSCSSWFQHAVLVPHLSFLGRLLQHPRRCSFHSVPSSILFLVAFTTSLRCTTTSIDIDVFS